jgi:hypothetical protein
MPPASRVPGNHLEEDDHGKVVKTEQKGEGIICGVRVLQEGHVYRPYDHEATYQEPPEWCATNHVDVYLVAVNYGQIVRVQPEDIVEIEEER